MGKRMTRRVFTPTNPPAGNVVSLADMKAHVRRDDSDDDAAISDAERAATRHIERLTGRLIPARSATLRLSGVPVGRVAIELPGGHVQELESVTIGGVSYDLDDFVVVGHSPARLIPTSNWPVLPGDEPYPVKITYTAGYETVPEDLTRAIRLLAGHFYEHREAVVTGASPVVLPLAVSELVSLHRIHPRG
jgi:uncharacterized phiE125 gp8 family phage protein